MRNSPIHLTEFGSAEYGAEPFVSERDAASFLGVSVRTMQRWRAAPLEVFLTRLYSPHSGLDYALMKRLPIDVLTNFFAFMVGEDPAPYLAAGEPGKEAVEIKFQQEMAWYGSLPVGDRELICEHFNETRDFTAAKRLLMYGDVIH